jgi:membrane associated rhomboid family serine protease
LAVSRTFGKRAQATPQPAVVARPAAAVAVAVEPSASPSFAGRFLSRVPWFTLVLSLVLSVRFTIEQKAATDFSAPGVPGHFSLLAMGASDRTQVLVHGEWWRLFTATMLHGSAEHLTGNLITFLLVGFLLEPMIGIGWFAAVYFTGGFAGAVLSTLFNGPDMLSVGASGAIMATLAALFTLSFHAGAPRPERMRRISAGALFPALIPAVTKSGAVVDINAHLGGCLAGAAIAFVMLIAWNDEAETPPARSIAAGVAGLWVAMTAWAFAVSGNTFIQYARPGLDLIPPGEMPKDVAALEATSMALVDKYPKDPRAHLFRGLYLVEQRDVTGAEPYFRDVVRMDGASQVMSPQMRDWNLALLAFSVHFQHRNEEAKNIAAPLCANTSQLDDRTRETLDQAQVCAP